MSLSLPVPSLDEAIQSFSAIVLTGGSSGIGKSLIKLGQKLSRDLVICNLSRREPAKISSETAGSTLHHFVCDLSHFAELERTAADVIAFLQRAAPAGQILLINNSGIGAFGRFPEPNVARELEIVDVNVRAVVHLTGLLLPLLKARGGAIMNIASTLAFQPSPFAATYGATKAFVLHWTLALNEELRHTRVRALAVCPGTTRTEFFRRAGLRDDVLVSTLGMNSDDVARAALLALASRRAQVVPGWKNKVMTFTASKLSKPMAARLTGKVLARRRPDQAPS